jgi:HPt (histidine-containing phosphotransfer) domain-containing protein
MEGESVDKAALVRLLEVIGGEFEDLVELIEEFEATTPVIMEKIQAASQASDWDTLRIQSHSLKSNARDFGAGKLEALCAVLEKQCRDGEVIETAGQVDDISHELSLARQALTVLDAGDIS